MGKDKFQRGAQANEIVQYTIPSQGTGQRTEDSHNAEDGPQTQDTQDILEALRGTRIALEGKMDTMAMDINNHLRLGFRKVAERVTSTEGEVADIQNIVRTLSATMETLQSEVT
ncbi:hypothetical protein NDU88_004765 [Pleurodeles waltl]|uniref:Uncharacterized protein n=1 Tax=Pleurodeles waltl TaxID=8319 RepID=A0AAV7SJV1_PLEWA|nr:hypothetical protein NDU88_004765 [Pleurodeles waltl]